MPDDQPAPPHERSPYSMIGDTKPERIDYGPAPQEAHGHLPGAFEIAVGQHPENERFYVLIQLSPKVASFLGPDCRLTLGLLPDEIEGAVLAPLREAERVARERNEAQR